MGLGLTFEAVKGSEVVAFPMRLENGEEVYLLPDARVEKDGANYIVATIATSPDRAVVLVEAGKKLIPVSASISDEILSEYTQYIQRRK